MLSTAAEREAQASELLRIACSDSVRPRLLEYAQRLTGSAEDGMDLYQQALLDTHEAVQLRGVVIRDVKFYLFGVMRNNHTNELRRRQGFAPLSHQPEEALEGELMPDETAVLAERVRAVMQEEFEPADRVLMHLDADGYSTQKIADMTGRAKRTVARRLAWMKDFIRSSVMPGAVSLLLYLLVA